MKFVAPIAGMFFGGAAALLAACWLLGTHFASMIDVCCGSRCRDYWFSWAIGWCVLGLGCAAASLGLARLVREVVRERRAAV